MFYIAVFLSKIAAFVLGLLGRGTDLPGRLALKLCPSLFSRFKIKGTVIAVTGSNGKTSTAGLIAGALQGCGRTVLHNKKGSNLTGGVATVLCRGCSLSGKINTDFVVLEVDERYSRLIFRDFKPHILLVTNLFRDQITRNNNVDYIYNILAGIISPGMTVIANACDPISCRLASADGVTPVFYGCEPSEYTTDSPQVLTHDAKACPVCKKALSYDFYCYNHIGKFHCEHCGFSSPECDFVMSEPDFDGLSLKINGCTLSCDVATMYGFFNLTAAAAACITAGIDPSDALAALSGLRTDQTRYKEIAIGDRAGYVILSKNQNPVSFDLSIGEVLRLTEGGGPAAVVAYINNINHTHQKDTTWLWDISFERLAGREISVVCAGPRAHDLAVRLKYAGFAPQQILLAPADSSVKPAVNETGGPVFILTELYDAYVITRACLE